MKPRWSADKERVLKKYPMAACVYWGLSERFVIKDEHGFGKELGNPRSRQYDAWATAAKAIARAARKGKP